MAGVVCCKLRRRRAHEGRHRRSGAGVGADGKWCSGVAVSWCSGVVSMVAFVVAIGGAVVVVVVEVIERRALNVERRTPNAYFRNL